MTITLTVENAAALPDGGPPRFQAARRGFLIGRERGLDWTLPDPSRFISSRHCEVRYHEGAYWLLDHSTNGVFVNGSAARMPGPHRLADGDRLKIGPYLVRVGLGATGVEQAAPPRGDGLGDPWGFGGGTSAPARGTAATSRGEPLGNPPQRPVPPPAGDGGAARVLKAFCEGAGVSPEAFAHLDPEALAFEIGAFVKLTAENVSDLLRARAAARMMTKSASRTVIGTADNNPLKHVPTAAEAVEVMFGRRRPGYLDARRSLADAFGDLKQHETATYAAMQRALANLLEPLAPESVEIKAGRSAFSSNKARAWEIFVERWREREAGENGMLDAFLGYFAEAYDAAAKKK